MLLFLKKKISFGKLHSISNMQDVLHAVNDFILRPNPFWFIVEENPSQRLDNCNSL